MNGVEAMASGSNLTYVRYLNVKHESNVLLVLLVFVANGQQQGGDSGCDPLALDQCIKMADPLLKEPKNVFPTSADDIDNVCRYETSLHFMSTPQNLLKISCIACL